MAGESEGLSPQGKEKSGGVSNAKNLWLEEARQAARDGENLSLADLQVMDELAARNTPPIKGGAISGRGSANRAPITPFLIEQRPTVNTPTGFAEMTLGIVFEQLQNNPGQKLSPEKNFDLGALISGLDNLAGGPPITLFEGAGARWGERQMECKEGLKLLTRTLLALRNRAVEIETAKGSLAVMGVVSPEIQAQTTIQFTNLEPEQHWVITHMDDVLDFVGNPEAQIPVVSALDEWKTIGEAYNVAYRGTISFKDGLTSDAAMAYLTTQIAGKLQGDGFTQFQSEWATQIASDYLTCTLTKSMWDKERAQGTSNAEDRDIMHFEFKRRGDFVKGDPAGPDITVGAYFADDNQGDPRTYFGDPPKWPEESKSRQLAEKRLRILRNNKEKVAVFIFHPADVTKAEIVGDFFRSVGVKDAAGNNRRLADFGWKQMPFWQLEKTQYAAYFGYDLAFADTIVKTIKEKGQDLKKLVDPGHWESMHKLTGRMVAFCPALLRMDRPQQTVTIDKFRYNYALGVFWCGSSDNVPDNPINPYKRAYWTEKQVRAVLQAMKQSNYLSRESMLKIEGEVLPMFVYRYAKEK
ncbi:MAG: hypothetical protein AAB506_01735 [Patescibacteria group bacterium]